MDQEAWTALVGLLGMLLVLAFGLVGLSASVWLMVWPVERRARATRGNFRFRLIDLGCLLVYWQVVLAVIGALRRTEFENAVGLVVCAGAGYFLVSAGTWWACVSVLSRAGIEASARRAAFMLVSIPGAVITSVTFVVSGMVMFVAGFARLTIALGETQEAAPPTPLGVSAALFAASIGAILLLRLLSLWIAANARAA